VEWADDLGLRPRRARARRCRLCGARGARRRLHPRPDAARGRLYRGWRDGRLLHAGYLDDYAFVIAGLLDLNEATGEPRWLREAIALDGVLAAHFEDAAAGGFFMTSDDQEALLAREKPAYDGAEPSGNSVQALNLLRLHELTTSDTYRQRAERTIAALAQRLEANPTALSEMLLALDWRLDAPKEIVIATARSRDEAAPFLAELRTRLVPNRILAVTTPGDGLGALVPVAEGKMPLGGRATGYVCENRVCDLPTTDPAVFAGQLGRVRPLPAASAGPSLDARAQRAAASASRSSRTSPAAPSTFARAPKTWKSGRWSTTATP
jgi:uncharacterized protein YyaL (SSP411 family)